MKSFFSIISLILLSIQFSVAQNIPGAADAARAELQKRGLQEDEVRARLLTRGIDIDNITAEQLPQLQPVLEQVVMEIEAEKVLQAKQITQDAVQTVEEQSQNAIEKQTTQGAAEISQEVQEKVQEGATVQEAVSETLTDKEQEKLPPATIYGQEIFRNQSLDLFRTTNDVKPPESYVLGAGDQLTVSIFGMSQTDLSFEIAQDGFVKPTGLPRIYLKGITYGQAKVLLRNRLAQFYLFKPEQFALSVSAARTITVNIFGEVQNYGSFTISAVNTAFNALVAAGGPTDIGTLRNIQVISNGRSKRLDVYEFLSKPNVQFDFFLQNNDIIHVPTAEKIVSISGNIRRPMRYELLQKENLMKLVEFAGGMEENAYMDNVQIRRISNNQRTLIDVNFAQLKANGKDFTLLPGDQIFIRAIPERFENFASIEGAVELPGDYEITPGMKISDLLGKGVPQPEARLDIAFLMRVNRDQTRRLIKINLDSIQNSPSIVSNVELQPKDKVMVYNQERFINKYIITVRGAVRNPLEVPFDPSENISVADLVLLSGGLDPTATRFAYIKRTDVSNSDNIEYLKVDVQAALSYPDSSVNAILKPLDVLSVYSKGRFTDEYSVSIIGAVREPDTFAFDESMRLTDIIYFSGGLLNEATDFGYIIRTDTTNEEIKSYIRLDVKKALENKGSIDDIILAPGDRINILKKSTFTDVSTVRVSGAVRLPGEYQFNSSLTVRDVLTMAGGLKIEASYTKVDINRVIIEQDRPTRTVVATVQVDQNYAVVGNPDFKLQPFDQIVVREVPDFEFQKIVVLNGEIQYPGPYAITSNNERIDNIIQRAGGLTAEAFSQGGQLYRASDNIGYVITRLDKVMRRRGSRYNYVLKQGDIITIPKAMELVTILLPFTAAGELYPDKLTSQGKISIAKKGNKKAGYYIKHYTAGFSENARRKSVTVEHPNGELKRTKKFLFLKFYPKVRKGSVIKIGPKPPEKTEELKTPKEPFDWQAFAGNLMAQVASVLTIVVLATKI